MTTDVQRALVLFSSPVGISEVRGLNCYDRKPGFTCTVSGYYDDKHFHDAGNHIVGLEKFWHAGGVYITLNPVMADLIARSNNRTKKADKNGTTKDKEIVCRRWMLCDFDPPRPAGISSTDEELASAYEQADRCREWLSDNGWPNPVVVMSGNGWHLLYRIELPTEDNRVELCLKALASQFSMLDASNHNASRITKLPGTMARKGDSTESRPHRRSRLEHVPDDIKVVHPECLDWLANQASKAEPVEQQNTGRQNIDQGVVDLELYAQNHCLNILKRDTFDGANRIFIECPGFASHTTKNSDSDCSIWQEHSGRLNAKCLHNSCGIHSWNDIKNSFGQVTSADFPNQTNGVDISGIAGDNKQAPVTESAKILASLKLLSTDFQIGIRTERDPYSILADVRKTADKIYSSFAKSTGYKVWTSAELDAADLRIEYLCKGILAKLQPCVLAASKKSLKTTFAVDLTLSLASGSMFLNKFHVPHAVPVALMSGESGDAVIQETARRIARAKPWMNLSDYTNAIWSFDLPKLGKPTTAAELTKFIKDNDLKVLAIDPAYLCLDLGDGAGNLFEVGPKLRELTDIGQETGCTIIIIHHNRKSQRESQFEPPELESIAWSGFQEWARQWILIGRREAYNPENAGSHRLWLVSGGSAGHSGFWAVDVEEGSQEDRGGRRWDIQVIKASDAVAEAVDQRESQKEKQDKAKAAKQLVDDSAKLLKEYQKRPQGDTERYFRDRTQLNGKRSGDANDKLLADGLIQEFDLTKNGRPYRGLRLVVASSEGSGSDRVSTGSSPACPDGGDSVGLAPLKGQTQSHCVTHEQSLFNSHVGNASPSPSQNGVVPEGLTL